MKRSVAKSKSRNAYGGLLAEVVELLEELRRAAARSVNAVMTATYWEIGRRIVEFEQGGARRAEYGERLIERLSSDLMQRFGRGFSADNLERMRLFYQTYPPVQISASLTRKSSGRVSAATKSASVARKFSGEDLAAAFPLSWTHYAHLLRRCPSAKARAFYEAEALRGGWSVRQLDRQIATRFYERTALSRDKAAMLTKGSRPRPGDRLSAEEEIKDPLVLEFLGLKDEYSESALEEALIRHLEHFLLELGDDFAFLAGKSDCAWATSGTASTCSSSTAGYTA